MFVKIPAGEFMMGSERGADDEKPGHRVKIEKPVLMSAHEVDYQSIPITWTDWSWVKAKAYCQAKTQSNGVTYRLPTEAEWEYACRAGTTTEYYWGDTPRVDCARFGGTDQGVEGPTYGGGRNPNAWGLYDMSGNLWEWCSSPYLPYPYVADDESENLATWSVRVLRGGAWDSDANSVRSASRRGAPAEQAPPSCGFRVVVSP